MGIAQRYGRGTAPVTPVRNSVAQQEKAPKPAPQDVAQPVALILRVEVLERELAALREVVARLAVPMTERLPPVSSKSRAEYFREYRKRTKAKS